MKADDLGVDPRTGRHTRTLTTVENRFLGILWTDHAGRANRIGAIELAVEFASRMGETFEGLSEKQRVASREGWKREVRHLQNHLLTEHSRIPLLSAAGINGGYWIAESEEETRAFYDTFRRRGLTGLVKASRGRQAEMVDMVKQLSFEFDDLDDRTGDGGLAAHLIRPAAGMPTPIEVVDAFLGKMLQEPEKFADGLRKIGKKYGSILLSKDRVEAMKRKARELEQLVEGL